MRKLCLKRFVDKKNPFVSRSEGWGNRDARESFVSVLFTTCMNIHQKCFAPAALAKRAGITACAVVLAFALLLAGCGAAPASDAVDEEEETVRSFFAMDTSMSILTWGADDALLEEAEDLVSELEAVVSATREGSELRTLNETGSVTLPDDAAFLLGRALDICGETGGALDITIYPVVSAWGFATAEQDYRVPGGDEIARLLQSVDYTRVAVEGDTVSLDEGMAIDLGAVTKGYVGDRIAALLRENGVTSALLDLGGNIQTIGSKPDGSDWFIAIKDPESDGILGAVPITDQAMITSGGYERYFVDEEGNMWWHIMDPATGYPAQSGLISVTVVGDEGLVCDALSTALFIMGPENAIQFWREHRDFEMALVTDEGELLLTPGLYDVFTPAEGLAYSLEVIGDA